MKKLLSISALLVALIFSGQAQAAGTRPGNMTASGAIVGSQIVWCPTGVTADFQCTFTQIDTFINAQFSGDFTVASGGAATLATVNANVGSFGSATQCITTTQNAKGLTTAISATTCTPAIGSITGWGTGVLAAAQAALNSSTGLIGALTPTNNNCVVGNGTAWTSAACPGGGSSTITAGTTPTSGFTNGHFVQSNGSVVQDATAVTSVGAGCGTSTGGSAITTTGTVASAMTLRSNTAASDTIVASDCGNVVYENRATAVAVSLAQAGTTGFGAGTFFLVCNANAGTATITPTTSTIGGAATLPITAGTAAAPNCVGFQSDGTNYNLLNAQSAGGGTPCTTTALAHQYNNSGAFGCSDFVQVDGNSVSQSNSTNAQIFYSYNTTDSPTSPTNYERVDIGWPGFDPNSFNIVMQHGGTGVARPVKVVTDNSVSIESGPSFNTWVFNGALNGFYTGDDGTQDVGLAGSNRPRDLNIARHMVAGNGQTVPAASTCGTSPAVASGSTDMGGKFTTGTGSPTACTITFNVAWPNFAWCTISAASSAAAVTGVFISAQSKTSFTVTTPAASGLSFNYTCQGN